MTDLIISRRILVASAALLAGCSPAYLLDATVSSEGVRETADIAYGPGPKRKLDLYQPAAGSRGAPLVVFLYGGSWRTGDKSLYPFVARPLVRRGAVVVVPNYRLYPEVEFPAFLDDNARAIAWAASHAAEFGADPARVFIVGHSAGAYNAAMLALDPHYLREAGYDRSRLAGVAGLAGPYDFLPITDPDVIPVFASVQDGPASQPVNYVEGRNPPMLLLAGTDDTTVNPRNTESLAEHIRAAGGTVQSQLFPGVGHIGLITAFAPLFQERAPVLEDVAAFLGLNAAS